MTADLKPLSAFLAALTLAFLLAVWLGAERVGEVIGLEDQLIEYLTAFLFFLGSVASGYAFLKGRHRGWAAFWCILCFLCMGEEVSWFQRVLGYSVPMVEGYSAQAEFNLHNLQVFGHGRLIGGNGGYNLSISTLLNSQNLFRLGFFVWFLALPVLTLVPRLKELAERLDYVRPSISLLAPLWLVLAFAAILTLSTVPPVKNYVAEATEFGYAAMVFLYTLLLVRAGEIRVGALRRVFAGDTGVRALRRA